MHNGPLPCFLSEQELEALLSQNLSPGQAQFRDGLNRLGCYSEDATYQKFIAYLREVSGGRRGTEKAKVTLDKILQFVTASAEIPVLGYYMPPKIEFFDDGSMLPRSSTCILYLPFGHLPDDTALFSFC
ncbi:hypothetical protein ACJMK2_018906 [Sinanodonta woodiana]|uniref:HECT domain-containing protein n=1 Tax=Sinanodonta woodiana TaxID=1069815 RepID=A0ABD3UG84_SINWO